MPRAISTRRFGAHFPHGRATSPLSWFPPGVRNKLLAHFGDRAYECCLRTSFHRPEGFRLNVSKPKRRGSRGGTRYFRPGAWRSRSRRADSHPVERCPPSNHSASRRVPKPGLCHRFIVLCLFAKSPQPIQLDFAEAFRSVVLSKAALTLVLHHY